MLWKSINVATELQNKCGSKNIPAFFSPTALLSFFVAYCLVVLPWLWSGLMAQPLNIAWHLLFSLWCCYKMHYTVHLSGGWFPSKLLPPTAHLTPKVCQRHWLSSSKVRCNRSGATKKEVSRFWNKLNSKRVFQW